MSGPSGPRKHGLRRAMGWLGRYRRDTVLALVSLLLVSAATLAAPALLKVAIDRGIAAHDWHMVLVAVGGLLGVAVARGIFSFTQGYLAERASQGVAYDMRNALFEHIGRLSFSYYDRTETGQLLTRLTSDVEQIRTFVGTGVVQLGASVVMLLGTVAVLLWLNALLAGVVLLTVVPILLLLFFFVRHVVPLFRGIQQALGRANATLQEGLAGIRTIRAFGREAYEAGRYARANDELLERSIAAIRAISNNFPFVFLFANLGTVAVVWVGGLEVIGGRLTLGELIAFNGYLAFLVQPLLTIGFLGASISRAAASSDRVFELLDAPLEVGDRPDAAPLPPFRGRIAFEHVSFRYPGTERDVLHDVSFTVAAGETVALLGATGSGKSTVVNLLPRFYDVTAGAVRIDGHDVRDVTLDSLRRQVGVVLQEVRLFAGTVAENIAYGRPDATREAVERAARTAQADGFIRELPEGYDTVLGERGVTLSGGQRQRLAIARALLVDPRILVLDDSTSALDAETEAALRAELDRLMRGREHTVVVIAQRVSTVRDADRILLLDHGRVVAEGTHESLRRESALYNAILASQLEAGGDTDAADAADAAGETAAVMEER